MYIRKCVGGMVFYKDQILLLQNEKHEWGFPVFVLDGMEDENTKEYILCSGIRDEVSLSTKLLQALGNTSYEFYSISRRRPICNEVSWYLLDLPSELKPLVELKNTGKYQEAGFFPMEEALEMITYSQDKSKLTEAYQTLIRTIYG